MTEYVTVWKDHEPTKLHWGVPVVRCRDCRYLDTPDWDDTLAALYGEPPTFCMNLSQNEWRMDGDRRVAETSFLEVEPDGFCAWGERKEVGA